MINEFINRTIKIKRDMKSYLSYVLNKTLLWAIGIKCVFPFSNNIYKLLQCKKISNFRKYLATMYFADILVLYLKLGLNHPWRIYFLFSISDISSPNLLLYVFLSKIFDIMHIKWYDILKINGRNNYFGVSIFDNKILYNKEMIT